MASLTALRFPIMLRIQEVQFKSQPGDTLTKAFRGLTEVPRFGTVHSIRSQPLPSIFSPITYLLLTPLYKATRAENTQLNNINKYMPLQYAAAALGGLLVGVLAMGPTVAGSGLAEDGGVLWVIKIREARFLRRGRKAVGPMSQTYGM
jgi:hypothetical protein